MDVRQLPFRYEDKQVMKELLKNVGQVIKNSDTSEEKQAIQRFLQQVSDVFTFVAIGSSQGGKGSLLNTLFQFTLFEKNDTIPTGGFCEYRSGVEEAVIHPDVNTTRIFRIADALEGLQGVDMPGADQLDSGERRECAR